MKKTQIFVYREATDVSVIYLKYSARHNELRNYGKRVNASSRSLYCPLLFISLENKSCESCLKAFSSFNYVASVIAEARFRTKERRFVPVRINTLLSYDINKSLIDASIVDIFLLHCIIRSGKMLTSRSITSQ